MFKLFRRKKNPLPLSFDYPVIRVDYRQFLSLPLAPKEPTIYSIAWNGAIYDILASRISRNRDAVILGSGDFDRAKIKSAPYFARHSWARDLNVNALWYFDPDCREGPATLSWCYGTNADWRLKNIASLLDIFFDRWEIQRKLFFGSSGGGFTSIALACLARSRAFAINPQLICLNFWPGIVGRFRKARLAEGERT